MLSQKVIDKLNEQINLEHFSSNLYLAMSSWCKEKGFDGSASFLMQHSKEELGHMYRLFQYVNDTGSRAIVGAISEPMSNFNSLEDVFQKTYEHEQKVTASIIELVDYTLANKDYPTFNFLQWYIAEQHEEEALFKGILDKMSIIGEGGRGLYMMDREIGQIALLRSNPTNSIQKS